MSLGATGNSISKLPDEISQLENLTGLFLGGRTIIATYVEARRSSTIEYSDEYARKFLCGNRLATVPTTLSYIAALADLELDNNPLEPELAAAYDNGIDAVKAYLRAKAEDSVVLNEAKLILIGEGEVGKSSLLGTMRGDKWVENRDTTHGIEIKPVEVRVRPCKKLPQPWYHPQPLKQPSS